MAESLIPSSIDFLVQHSGLEKETLLQNYKWVIDAMKARSEQVRHITLEFASLYELEANEIDVIESFPSLKIE